MARGYTTKRGKPAGYKSAVGAENPSQAARLNKLKTPQPVVPHNKAHGAKKK